MLSREDGVIKGKSAKRMTMIGQIGRIFINLLSFSFTVKEAAQRQKNNANKEQ